MPLAPIIIKDKQGSLNDYVDYVWDETGEIAHRYGGVTFVQSERQKDLESKEQPWAKPIQFVTNGQARDLHTVCMDSVANAQPFAPILSRIGVVRAMEYLRSKIEGRIFIDFGAGRGNYGILAHRYGAKAVYFVEKYKKFHVAVRKNAALNGMVEYKDFQIMQNIARIKPKNVQGSVLAMNTGWQFGREYLQSQVKTAKGSGHKPVGIPEWLIISGGRKEEVHRPINILDPKHWNIDCLELHDEQVKDEVYVTLIAQAQGLH
ncbi:MAG: hypothetical protein ACI9CF_000596 [Candidatus Omnitrophota bacterium]|jgi:hypothetical protein